MLVDFCLRLATGMLFCLLLLSPGRTARPTPARKPLTNANFFRTQLLVVLALAVGCLLWLRSEGTTAMLIGLALAGLAAFLGSITWSLEGSPGGVFLMVACLLLFSYVLTAREWVTPEEPPTTALLGGFGSALLLGSAISAMLLGHNYLVAPSMSMTPLYRLLGALAVALAVRAVVDGTALGIWSRSHSFSRLGGDAVLWLPVRWAVGIAAPAVLCYMAWQTARIRSTQSATGILYVVVIFCFLGELTARLIRPMGLSW